jgi:Tol biopolymer transport system component
VNSATLDQVSASGGETVALPAPFGIPRLLDMSPSRSELLVSTVVDVRRASPLWLLPLPAGMPRRLGDVLADDATWSPDGREIVYVRDQDVYRAKKDGSDVRKLVTLPAVPSWPRWSPDGTRLRLTLTDNETGVSSLWEMSVDGKRVHPLLPGWSRSPAECCGSWTSDGKYFVFQSTQNDKTDIWVMAERRGVLGLSANTVSTPEQLTAGQLNSLAPVLSPDNKTVYVIGEQLRGELVRYDSKLRQFVTYSSRMSAEFVDFSSDGQWMAYVAFPEGTLWRSRTDGTERLQLTFPSARVTAPRWAPDGTRIAFFDAAPGKPWRMYVVAADGGRPEPLLEEPHNQMDPNWSPDGNAVVFSYFPLLETSTSEIVAIYLFDLKTHHVTKLPGSDGLWAPRWSRDGRYIVARASSEAPRLLLFDFETQRWVELIKDTAGWANWSRDGQYIYYLRRGKEPAILRVRVSDHTVEEVASLKDVRQTGFRSGVWTGLAPDDSPLVLRDIGSREIYALDWEAR